MESTVTQSRNGGSRITPLRLGELFCGPGGLALGALGAEASTDRHNLRFVHQWATDYDPDACATYRRNICPSEPLTVICEDVRRLNLGALPLIDAFAFGFPCNDFSVVGEKRGIRGEFGPLYSYGVRVLEEFRPRVFVAENVGGIRSANEGRTFHRILSDLRKAGGGYRLTAHLYKFEDYGVPQSRHRVIIVGVDESLGVSFRVPEPTCLGNPVSVRAALTDPPIPKTAPNNERTTQNALVVERLKLIQPGMNIWQTDLPPHLRLDVKGAKMSMIYRRLDPDRPSYTVTGSGGGGTHLYHWKEPRALTNRERARIQTFPDSFVFEGQKESVRRQIGMAVPPRAATVIFEAILKMLAGVSYPSVPASLEGDVSLASSKAAQQVTLKDFETEVAPAQ